MDDYEHGEALSQHDTIPRITSPLMQVATPLSVREDEKPQNLAYSNDPQVLR